MNTPIAPIARRGHDAASLPWGAGLILAALAWGTVPANAWAGETPPLVFGRDVLPILTDHCFPCHGPDVGSRKADLRLDIKEGVLRLENPVVVPGHGDASELILRITSDDADEVMPPPKSKRKLSPRQIDVLRRWIDEGAKWGEHWAFKPPRPIAPPKVRDRDWPRGEIDRFVLARLEREGLPPSPEAERATLIRRAALDLTGLPPSPGEIDDFLADAAPDAYGRLVDRLFASPHFGERMALEWLDVARYADSGGYQGDIFRTMWPWRDWVVAAYNRNLPFDRFTVEQLAGDLLPNPTREQRIATGFNRNHRINDEDGIIPEEFRVEYVADRAETTASVWLGLTMGCARCHAHKYDPIAHEEYYAFYAFFNSIAEKGRGHGNAPPLLHDTSPEQEARLAVIESRIEPLRAERDRLALDPASAASLAECDAILKDLEGQRTRVLKGVTTMMVMSELEQPRDTFLLTRGAYDKPSVKVVPGVPRALPPLPPGAPSNRLGLARWLVDPAHPLTARVTVNRAWQMLFGVGLVATSEDFGIRGDPPSHPDLLDWLATEFVRSGWDVKALLRQIVTSAVYRQSSRGDAELYRRDPENRLLARGPRFRLPAELIRDQALAASGLLVPRIGGPPVRPYQPEGLWKELAAVNLEYDQDHGADLHRGSLYTFWRRTIPPPALSAFDAPSREVCAVRRARTNTPLQALVLMNDPTYVEAARALAARALREGGVTPEERIAYAFRLVTARRPVGAEMAVLRATLNRFRDRFTFDPESARRLVAVGESPAGREIDACELAAYTSVASTVLNLDEAITKE